MRLRDIAASLNITERSAFGIITDLVEAGYLPRIQKASDKPVTTTPGNTRRSATRSETDICPACGNRT
jgi:hypothetical protein